MKTKNNFIIDYVKTHRKFSREHEITSVNINGYKSVTKVFKNKKKYSRKNNKINLNF
jgi:hypothetical protein